MAVGGKRAQCKVIEFLLFWEIDDALWLRDAELLIHRLIFCVCARSEAVRQLTPSIE